MNDYSVSSTYDELLSILKVRLGEENTCTNFNNKLISTLTLPGCVMISGKEARLLLLEGIRDVLVNDLVHLPLHHMAEDKIIFTICKPYTLDVVLNGWSRTLDNNWSFINYMNMVVVPVLFSDIPYRNNWVSNSTQGE